MARAQAPSGDRVALVESGYADAPSWWGETGRPGWIPDVGWGLAYPWALAGHVRGAWTLVVPGAPAAAPFPGVVQAQQPLAWNDSIAVSAGGRGAWEGFEGSLAQAQLIRRPLMPPQDGRASALGEFVLGSGGFGYDENALWLRRADSLSLAEAGAEGWTRQGLGPYGKAGRHQYGIGAARMLGRVRVEGMFAQRGSAGALLAGEEQSVSGASSMGKVAYTWGRRELTLALGRGFDHHESFGGVLVFSRREAREDGVAFEVRADSAWRARLGVRDARVTRMTDGLPRQAWEATSVWVALEAEGQRNVAHFTTALGVGRHGGVGRTEFVPSAGIAFAEGPFDARLFFERVVVPVWSDLAPGQDAFLQDTWAGGFEIGLAAPKGSRGRIGWLMGRTRDRAIVERLPLEELWLRSGFEAEPDVYDFGLGTVAGEWQAKSWVLGGEAFALLRDRATRQPNVDPARGARSFAEFRFHAFRGDLRVVLRGEMGAIGPRESEAAIPKGLPGYVTYGAVAALTLADATVTARMRNLEDEPRLQTWVDSFTGREAVGPGREFRLSLAWRLFN